VEACGVVLGGTGCFLPSSSLTELRVEGCGLRL